MRSRLFVLAAAALLMFGLAVGTSSASIIIEHPYDSTGSVYDASYSVARDHASDRAARPRLLATSAADAVEAPDVGGHVYDSSADFVAPRTTSGTAIEPMWAQAPSRGFLGGWSRADTLKPGTVFDRYGGETGRFFSPQGTPLDARALPTGSGPLNTYEVLKPLR